MSDQTRFGEDLPNRFAELLNGADVLGDGDPKGIDWQVEINKDHSVMAGDDALQTIETLRQLRLGSVSQTRDQHHEVVERASPVIVCGNTRIQWLAVRGQSSCVFEVFPRRRDRLVPLACGVLA